MDLPADPTLHKIGMEYAQTWIKMLKDGREMELFDVMTNAGCGGPFKFSSPVVHTGYSKRREYEPILKSVLHVLKELSYTEVFVGTDKATNTARVALHFSAKVTTSDGKVVDVDGIDLLIVDGKTKKATELKVMVRPLSAMKSLQQGMMKQISSYIKNNPSKM